MNSTHLSEEATVRRALRELAVGEHPQLPDPDPIWYRAQIIEDLGARDAPLRHLTRPLVWAETIGLSIVAAGLLVALALAGVDLIIEGATRLLSGPVTDLAAGTSPLPIGLTAILAPLLTLIGLLVVWRES